MAPASVRLRFVMVSVTAAMAGMRARRGAQQHCPLPCPPPTPLQVRGNDAVGQPNPHTAPCGPCTGMAHGGDHGHGHPMVTHCPQHRHAAPRPSRAAAESVRRGAGSAMARPTAAMAVMSWAVLAAASPDTSPVPTAPTVSPMDTSVMVSRSAATALTRARTAAVSQCSWDPRCLLPSDSRCRGTPHGGGVHSGVSADGASAQAPLPSRRARGTLPAMVACASTCRGSAMGPPTVPRARTSCSVVRAGGCGLGVVDVGGHPATTTPLWTVTSAGSRSLAIGSNRTGGPCAEYACSGGECVAFQQVSGYRDPQPRSGATITPLPGSALPWCYRCAMAFRTAVPVGRMNGIAASGGHGGHGAPAPTPVAPACSAAHGAATSSVLVCCTGAAGRLPSSSSASASPAPVSPVLSAIRGWHRGGGAVAAAVHGDSGVPVGFGGPCGWRAKGFP